jgi:predicted ABC-type ATPase
VRPALFIITGSNGAGKSTVGATYLPSEIQDVYTVFDGDKLALEKRKELYPRIIKALKEAKNIASEFVDKSFLQQVKAAITAGDHFVYEGHFRDVSTLKTPRKFKKKGYYLSLIFMGVSDPHVSELRVINRAKEGGHFVPIYEVESNFYGNLVMLNKNYKLFDELMVIDTSSTHKILLHMRDAKILFYVPSKHQPRWFLNFLPNLLKMVKQEELKVPNS